MLLTYDEYINMGGTIEKVPFDILAKKSENIIHRETYKRLTLSENYTKCKQSVDYCQFALIDFFNKQEQKLVTSVSNTAGSESQSESYSYTKDDTTTPESIIRDYLESESTVDDVPLLERSMRGVPTSQPTPPVPPVPTQETDPVYTADKPNIALKTDIPTDYINRAGLEEYAQPKGEYATAEQGAKADSALQSEADPIYLADKPDLQAFQQQTLSFKQDTVMAINTLTSAISELNTRIDNLVSSLSIAIVQSRQQAEAYALKLVNEYADSMLYFQNTGTMTPDKPTAPQSKNVTLTTTEQLIDTQTYTINEPGTLKHNAIYSFPYTITSVSSSRDTTIKIKYSVNDVVIAQLIAQYRASYIDLSEIEVVSLLNVDIDYTTANIKCEVFAKTSNSTDDVTVVYNDGMQFSGVKRELIV